MKLKDFQARLETINIGDYVTLTIRGNYGNYIHQGKLAHIKDDYRIHLDNGKAHSYKRIISIGLTPQK